ncbi:MAG: hypothetical protein JRI59_01835 [Deltaproteobacteria bacterium]|nr:hypothetical protein [Deltaproteobacteria bacterium]
MQRQLRQGEGERTRILTLLAQVCWTLGEIAPADQRLKHYEKGSYYGSLLVREQPDWADGYYWQAMNLCGVAEVGGAGRALRLLPVIVQTMKKAAAIDPTLDQGGPHRILGRIFYEAPAWPFSVGDIHKSLYHLTLAVQIAPHNSTNHLYLGETLLRLGKEQEAQMELIQVFSSTQHASWPLGLEQDRQEARRILAQMNQTP